jgi:hypothetical protein
VAELEQRPDGSLDNVQRALTHGLGALRCYVTLLSVEMERRGRRLLWAAALVGLGLVGMVLMAIIGATVTGRRMKAIGRGMVAGDGPIPGALRERFEDPALRMSASVRVALALGIVFNMSVKPAAGGAVAALVIAAALGLLSGQLAHGSSRPMRRPAVQE